MCVRVCVSASVADASLWFIGSWMGPCNHQKKQKIAKELTKINKKGPVYAEPEREKALDLYKLPTIL